MAKSNSKFTPTIFILLLILSIFTPLNSQEFSTKISKNKLGLKKEKLSHLHFYFHDIVSGKNPTAVQVAEASITNKSQTGFGSVVMIDDPLTVSPDVGSKIVGRAQGIYASASIHDLGLLMAMNLVFVEGKYNGSCLSVLGRNAAMSSVREMPIVGGSGLFRFARGYALAKTHAFDYKTGDAVVEYNVKMVNELSPKFYMMLHPLSLDI